MIIKGNILEKAEVIWQIKDYLFLNEITEELKIAIKFLK